MHHHQQNGSVANGYTLVDIEESSSALKKPMPDDYKKTLVAMVIALSAWLSNDFVLAVVHDRVPNHSDPLPDIWFTYLPEITDMIKVAEVFICLELFIMWSLALLHEHRWIVIRRILLIASMAYFGRAICVALTQVPVPSRKTYCGPKANQTSFYIITKRAFKAFSGLGMDMHGRSLCGDLIYSGHTIVLVMCHLTTHRYAPRRLFWISWLTKLFALAGMICILLARKHYTIDIVLAYFVTTRVFYNYHTLVDIHCRRINCESVPIANVIWFPIFQYFESDITTQVPNNFFFRKYFQT